MYFGREQDEVVGHQEHVACDDIAVEETDEARISRHGAVFQASVVRFDPADALHVAVVSAFVVVEARTELLVTLPVGYEVVVVRMETVKRVVPGEVVLVECLVPDADFVELSFQAGSKGAAPAVGECGRGADGGGQRAAHAGAAVIDEGPGCPVLVGDGQVCPGVQPDTAEGDGGLLASDVERHARLLCDGQREVVLRDEGGRIP